MCQHFFQKCCLFILFVLTVLQHKVQKFPDSAPNSQILLAVKPKGPPILPPCVGPGVELFLLKVANLSWPGQLLWRKQILFFGHQFL